MNLFALSFDHSVMEGEHRYYISKFVPITPEQARDCFTVTEIPTDEIGKVVTLYRHKPRPGSDDAAALFKVVGINQFRPLTNDEAIKYMEESNKS